MQHLLQEHAAEIRHLILNQRAQVYVCGDAKYMAKDVFEAVAGIVAMDERCKGDEGAAKDILYQLKMQGRWLEDVW